MWNQSYDKAFRQAKLHVANGVTLKYFNPLKSSVLECDAPGVWISGALFHTSQAPVKH